MQAAGRCHRSEWRGLGWEESLGDLVVGGELPVERRNPVGQRAVVVEGVPELWHPASLHQRRGQRLGLEELQRCCGGFALLQ